MYSSCPDKLIIEPEELPELTNSVINTWNGQFNLIEEIKTATTEIPGLRPPQIGAIWGILSHWTQSNKPATIVLPTGTGKTETMLGLLIVKQLHKLLVIVPNDALRTQTAKKFITLGILKTFGVVGEAANYPIVGILLHKPNSIEQVDQFFSVCNVVVTTMSIAGSCSNEIQKQMAVNCSHLFIDEAHHIPAPTWEKFRNIFIQHPIVQFTATPFRRDGKHVDGKVIYNYPLESAQRDGYFKPITFVPVFEFDEKNADKEIAKQAINQLTNDLSAELDHLVLVRAKSIDRATEVFEYYKPYSQLNPVLIHSNLPKAKKQAIMQEITSRSSRIIVCVDMFGEGFDLPELKIAALHDIHKSLGIILQFVGRFARVNNPNIGEAHVIANVADPDVNTTLQSLYSESADWNTILKNTSHDAIQKQVELSHLISDFDGGLVEEIPLQNIFPKMSTVVYQTSASSWHPENYSSAFSRNANIISTINSEKKILIIIEKNTRPVDWGDIKEISNITWDIYIAYWNTAKNLLFINSTTSGAHLELAEAIIESPTLISGETVFRSFDGIKRVVLYNVGLKDGYSGPIRFRLYAGIDIVQGLSDAHKRNTFKSNIFGIGYENDEKTSAGCSFKGKIWSKKIATLSEWCSWCDTVGHKLLNQAANVDHILDGVLKPELVTDRPAAMPIAIEWPMELFADFDTSSYIIHKDQKIPLHEVSIDLLSPSETGDIAFKIYTEKFHKKFTLKFIQNREGRNYAYIEAGDSSLLICKGSRTKSAVQWFYDDPPRIRFADGSCLENNVRITPCQTIVPFNIEKISPWDWSGVDIRKESQGYTKESDSIQRKLIAYLLTQEYNIIFDDDTAGEAADVITIKLESERIKVEFYHCKFSHGDKPGARVSDLYEVCGQAQKSINWRENILYLIKHMEKREELRLSKSRPSRFEKGDLKILNQLKKMSGFYKYHLDIYIVQPGLSKSVVSIEQLELLGATENYLKETYSIALGVISSN